jgi:hypothetical protein
MLRASGTERGGPVQLGDHEGVAGAEGGQGWSKPGRLRFATSTDPAG